MLFFFVLFAAVVFLTEIAVQRGWWSVVQFHLAWFVISFGLAVPAVVTGAWVSFIFFALGAIYSVISLYQIKKGTYSRGTSR